jgi:hypothetical protein
LNGLKDELKHIEKELRKLTPEVKKVTVPRFFVLPLMFSA